jgi:hypothetical protein
MAPGSDRGSFTFAGRQKEGRRQLASQVGDLGHGALGGLDRIPDDVGQSSERGNFPLGSLVKLLFVEAVP